MARNNDTRNGKFILADASGNYDNKKRKIYLGFDLRVIIYGLLIFIFLIGAFVSYLNLYLSCADIVVSYKEESDVSYNVCLENNNIYEEPCLKEGMEYLSLLTSAVNSKFFYHVDFSTDIDYDLKYKVVAKTKVLSRDEKKLLFEKEEELIAPKRIAGSSKEININQIVEIDFKKYSNLVENYINTYAEGADALVDVELYLIEPKETRKLSSLSIPLASQTFNVSKEIISYSDEVRFKNNYWDDENTLYGIVGTACLLILTFFIYRLTRLVVLTVNTKSKYQVELDKILKEYDNYIVSTNEGYTIAEDVKVIKVSSFKELLDARNALNKPIIFTKINNVKCEFIVEDESTIYRYVMKEADL